MKAFGNGGGVDQIAGADLADDVTVERSQFDAQPLHFLPDRRGRRRTAISGFGWAIARLGTHTPDGRRRGGRPPRNAGGVSR